MTLAFFGFAIFCCVFVAAVFVLVFWTIINGLRDEAKHRKQGPSLEKDKPAPGDEGDKPA
ncbi:MAG: hypothetical protein ABSF74_06010 [Dehalococcoidia bacterium]|jgi:hypothetical protein